MTTSRNILIGILISILIIGITGCIESSTSTNTTIENTNTTIENTIPIRIINPLEHAIGENHIFKNGSAQITTQITEIIITSSYKITSGYYEKSQLEVFPRENNQFIWINIKSINTGDTTVNSPYSNHVFITINEIKYDTSSIYLSPLDEPYYIKNKILYDSDSYTGSDLLPNIGISGWMGFEIPKTNNFKIYIAPNMDENMRMAKQLGFDLPQYPTFSDQYAYWNVN